MSSYFDVHRAPDTSAINTTVVVVLKIADWNANEFSNTPPADGFL